MSYLVLARKYRPRDFSQMAGQEHVVQALGNALEQQRLHHAYMFTGTRGVGKTTISRILAKALNCTKGITPQPCGECAACSAIDAGRFADYIELDAASNRGVDEVQSLLEQAAYKPVQGRFKVFMIDEVHMLTNTAFNAMLKTLEEPPPYLKFVLATTDPQKVPITVLSRCLQFNLRPMSPQTIQEHLRSVLEQESTTFEDQALSFLARAARGSMRDALSLTDQAIAFGQGQLRGADVRQMLGAVGNQRIFALIRALAQGEGRALVQEIDALAQNGASAGATLEELCLILQRMAVFQAVPDFVDTAHLDDPDNEELKALAQSMPADETQLCYSIALHGQQELGLAPDEYSALTMILLRPLAFKEPRSKGSHQAPSPYSPPPPPIDQPTESAPAPAPESEPEPQPLNEVTKESTDTELSNFWFERVEELLQSGAITGLARELALHSQLTKRTPERWYLSTNRSSLCQAAHIQRLEQALNQSIDVESIDTENASINVSDTPFTRLQERKHAHQRHAEEQVQNDPRVQTLMRDFGARIVQVSPHTQ